MTRFYDRYDKNPIKISSDYNNDGTDDYIFSEVTESIVDENIGDGLQNIVASVNDSKKRLIALKSATKSTIGGVIVGDGIDVDNGLISLGQDVRQQLATIEQTAADNLEAVQQTAADNLQESKRYTDQTITDLKAGVGNAYDTLVEIEEKFNDNDNVTANIIQAIDDNKTEINERVDLEVVTLNTRLTTEVTTLNTRTDTEVSTLNATINTNVADINKKIDDLSSQTGSDLTDESTKINTRIDTEVTTLNTRIDDEVSTLNTRVDTEVDQLNTTIGENKAATDQNILNMLAELTVHERDFNNPHNVTAGQVGLGNVTNESKVSMFNNPVFTGRPTAPTPVAGDSSKTLATTEYVTTAVKTQKDTIVSKHFFGIGVFNGLTGVTMGHNLGTAEYTVSINLRSIPDGAIGDIGYIKDLDSVMIFNTGSAGAEFDVMIIAKP